MPFRVTDRANRDLQRTSRRGFILERAGWQVEIADAQKGLASLARKTDRIAAWVLAELSRRELVPAIGLPDPYPDNRRA